MTAPPPDFFMFYLQQHRHPETRNCHYIGTTFVLISAGITLWTQWWPGLAFLPVFGYGPAWLSHWLIERNHPATWTYPLRSLGGDFKMWFLFLFNRARLRADLERAGVA